MISGDAMNQQVRIRISWRHMPPTNCDKQKQQPSLLSFVVHVAAPGETWIPHHGTVAQAALEALGESVPGSRRFEAATTAGPPLGGD